MIRRLAILAVTIAACNTSYSQDNEADARALLQTYIERHNSHDLAGVMALYAEDAVFYLSMGRPSVHGRKAIEGLERFDVAAQSTIYPQGVQIERDGEQWRVHIEGAIEHSEIFEAAGVSIVMAMGIRNAFVLRDSKIIEIHQPDLQPACTDIVLGAFRNAVAWMSAGGDVRQEQLVDNGFIKLTPATIPDVVKLLREWRQQSGVAPTPRSVSACAKFEL